jgi:hypothetical protein
MYVENGLFMNERAFPRLLLVTPMASTVWWLGVRWPQDLVKLVMRLKTNWEGNALFRIFGVLDCLKTDAGYTTQFIYLGVQCNAMPGNFG